MYEMVKKIIGVWPLGKGCRPPTEGPCAKLCPLPRRCGPGPLRGLGAGHGALPVRGHSARARHAHPPAEPVSASRQAARSLTGGALSTPLAVLRPQPSAAGGTDGHRAGPAPALLVLTLVGVLWAAGTKTTLFPEGLGQGRPGGFPRWHAESRGLRHRQSGLGFHFSGSRGPALRGCCRPAEFLRVTRRHPPAGRAASCCSHEQGKPPRSGRRPLLRLRWSQLVSYPYSHHWQGGDFLKFFFKNFFSMVRFILI